MEVKPRAFSIQELPLFHAARYCTCRTLLRWRDYPIDLPYFPPVLFIYFLFNVGDLTSDAARFYITITGWKITNYKFSILNLLYWNDCNQCNAMSVISHNKIIVRFEFILFFERIIERNGPTGCQKIQKIILSFSATEIIY